MQTEAIFLNVYRTESGSPYAGGMYDSREVAERVAHQNGKYVGCFQIDIPVEGASDAQKEALAASWNLPYRFNGD